MMMAQVRRNRGNIVWYVLVVLLSLVVAFVIAEVVALSDRAEEGREDRDVLIEDVRVLRDQVESMGQTPAAPEPEERVAEDPPPPVSDERLDAAVERFCGLPGCRGPRGFPGADSTVPGPRGRPPTREEIGSAVAGFCGARNDCVGPAGEDSTVPGPAGQDGADSTVPGPQGDPGRPPTAEEIADAVTSFCAEGACQGAAGADGDNGRGLTGTPEILLRDDGECVLRFHYTAEPLSTDTPMPNRFCRPDLLE